MEAILPTSTSLHPLGWKCFFSSSPSSSNGASIFTSVVNNKARIRLTKPAFIFATLSKPTNETSADPVAPRKRVSPESLQYEAGCLGAVPDRTDSGGDGVYLHAKEYLTGILSSQVYDVAIKSPLQHAPLLSNQLGVDIWLKREDLQPVFSFKLRGAYNMMAKLPREQLEKGVICSSSGNHAQGVALAANKLQCNAVIALPTTTADITLRAVKKFGANVVLVGDSYDEAQAYAIKCSKEKDYTYIPPFDHPDVIIGQGTVGMEIMSQMKGPLHAIFVPVGGGGLIAGIAAYVKSICPEVKIIGVEPFDANAMALSIFHGERVVLDQVGRFTDCVAVKEVGEETFRICNELIDGVVLVDRDAICASIKDMFEETNSLLEPAGALSLAGAQAYCKYYGLKGENVVAITSGATMPFEKLRSITRHANVGRQQEAVLETVMPEKPGSFKRLCELVGPMNFTEFKYRYRSAEEAIVLYSVSMRTASELEEMLEQLESSQLKTYNRTKDFVVRDHLRNMMGCRSNLQNEIFCRFIFPERPGALLKFLDAFSPRWNITLFEYHYQGQSSARVLVGLQVDESEMAEFHSRANSLGYDYIVVTDDPVFDLFVR